jgi:DNA modification methylase
LKSDPSTSINIKSGSCPLVSRILKFATEKGDWVLDPFAGRGTTGIACTYLGRNFTGIDLYEENVVRAQKNIAYAMDEIYKLNEK